MSSQPDDKHDPAGIDDDAVAAYLATNPDFFERHLDLLETLLLPHPTGQGAISLVERQLDTLRQRLRESQRQLNEFVDIARENDSLNQRLHHLTLSLIDTASLDEWLAILQDEMREHFDADAVEIKLFSHEDLRAEAEQGKPGPALFRNFMDTGQPCCGQLDSAKLLYLFGPQAGETGSAALIPLSGMHLMGVLAVGSQDPRRFHPGQGVEFLRRLGDVISRTLQVVCEPGQ